MTESTPAPVRKVLLRSSRPCARPAWHLLVPLLTLVAIIDGCSAGHDYVRPSAEVTQTYKEAGDWNVAQPQDGVSRGKWWEAYSDPELNALEEQAMTSNQGLAAAEANLREARSMVRAAKADFYPTAAVGLSAGRVQGSSHLGSSKQSTHAPAISNYSSPIDISWEPDLWGRVRRTVEASEAGAQASEADLESARLSLGAELATDYFSLRAIDADKALLDETVAAYERSLEITHNRYAGGVAARSEVVLATAQLESTRAQRLDLGVQRARFEHAIAVLIGKPPAALSLPVAPLAATPLVASAALPSQLLERRPDIAAAERRVTAANAEIGVAEAAYFPTVSLNASAGLESSHLSNWFSWPSRFWALGPSISQTVYDGGRRKAQTEQARALYDGAVAAYRQSVLAGFQEVEDNLAALRILEQEAEVQQNAVKLARETVTLTMNQYKAGTVNFLSVVVVQAAALGAQRSAVDIHSRRMAASVLLTKALGGAWQE